MQRSLRVFSAVGLAALLSACSPNIAQNPQTPVVIIEFDPAASPPVVPSPNNLAINPATGLISVPASPTDTPTTTAFNESYLNTLDGFPMETPASCLTTADVSPPTLATGVLVLDITNPTAPAAVTVTATYASSGADAGGGTITIPPPGGAWTRGHTYAAAIIGGAQPGAVVGTGGREVTSSATWALVASAGNCTSVSSCGAPIPVCALPDGGAGGPNSGCLPTTDLIPSAEAAAQLQVLQTGYAPLLAALGGAPFNIPRANVSVLWTFSITTQAEVTFDPANTVIPFPNDVVRQGPGGTVSLPTPAGTPAALAELIAGLNTLNGFSTTATIQTAVDFNLPNDGVSALLQGKLDPKSISPPLAIGIAKVAAVAGAAASQGDPQVGFCVSDVAPGCPLVTATLPDGGAKPEVLGIVPLSPLDEHTQYAVYMTNAIRDTSSKPVIATSVFALVRLPVSTAPLFKDGKSQVPSLLTDAQAEQLFALQSGLAPLFGVLGGQGIPYSSVVQAWAFTTQSEVSLLQQLASIPYNPAAAFPSNPLWVEDVTLVVRPQLTAAGVPTTNIMTFYAGEIVDPFALTSPFGTFNPDGGIEAVPIPFIMTVPVGTTPTTGFPVTMFGHGLTGDKTNAYAIANSLGAAGQVMIAIDEVWHGQRNTCTGFGAFADAALGGGGPLPDGGYPDFVLCTTAATAPTDCNSVGRCQLSNRAAQAACAYGTATADETCFNLGQNSCAPDSKCEGATDFKLGYPYSGWNLINLANFFASRDNLRQQVIDDSQFARVASGTGTGSLSALTVPLNPAAISYSGQSLGGIMGTLYTSVAFNVHNAGLNVPGGDPVEIILTSPSFTALAGAYNAGLAASGIPTNSPTYDLLISIDKWILDPADPTNMAYYTIHPTGIPSVTGGPSIPSTRRTFVQWIVGDQTVPNPTTVELVEAALHNPAANSTKVNVGSFWSYQFNNSSSAAYQFTNPAVSATYIPPANRHPFLLAPPPVPAGVTLTTDAQTQLVGFLSGVAPF